MGRWHLAWQKGGPNSVCLFLSSSKRACLSIAVRMASDTVMPSMPIVLSILFPYSSLDTLAGGGMNPSFIHSNGLLAHSNIRHLQCLWSRHQFVMDSNTKNCLIIVYFTVLYHIIILHLSNMASNIRRTKARGSSLDFTYQTIYINQ